MAITYLKFFQPTVLTTSAATLYTVPASPATNLLRGGRMRFTNTTNAGVNVDAYAVPVSGAAGAGNAFLFGKSISPNDYLDVDIPYIKAGDFLQALASTGSSITVQIISGSLFS